MMKSTVNFIVTDDEMMLTMTFSKLLVTKGLILIFVHENVALMCINNTFNTVFQMLVVITKMVVLLLHFVKSKNVST